MKKLMIPYMVFLYLTQMCILAFIIVSYVFQTTDGTVHPVANIMFFVSLCVGIFTSLWGFGLFVHALLHKYDVNKCPYKMTMVTKLILVPYFVINFVLGMMLSTGLLLWFVAPFILMTLMFDVLLTYGTMIATSSYNLVYMFKSVKLGNKKWNEYVLYFILHFIFIADIVASIMIWMDSRKLDYAQQPLTAQHQTSNNNQTAQQCTATATQSTATPNNTTEQQTISTESDSQQLTDTATTEQQSDTNE